MRCLPSSYIRPYINTMLLTISYNLTRLIWLIMRLAEDSSWSLFYWPVVQLQTTSHPLKSTSHDLFTLFSFLKVSYLGKVNLFWQVFNKKLHIKLFFFILYVSLTHRNYSVCVLKWICSLIELRCSLHPCLHLQKWMLK